MDVVYDLARVVVIDKPAGTTSEDAARALGRRLVHRLDKATSGLLVLADDARTVQRLQRALAAGAMAREYAFVAHGHVVAGALHSELVRDRGDGLRGSGPGGKPACTRLVVHGRAVVGDVSLSFGAAQLVTGRTHQIRIHLAEAGHPLVGERVYVRDHLAAGGVLAEATRLMLHAHRLAFVHPNTHRDVVVESPVPWALPIFSSSPSSLPSTAGPA